MKNNLTGAIPDTLPEELVTRLGGAGEVRIERIISRGHASPPGFWYDQPQDEFVLLVEGGAGLEFADQGGTLELAPGDYLTIPAGVRHRVTWTDPERDTIWLTVHHPPQLTPKE